MSEGAQRDEALMARALELARAAWGRTHPNPMVGALIAEGGEVRAEGTHRSAGEPHAEIDALRQLGRKPAADATLYVTLEPCSTQGRTGACTDAILESGVSRVAVGAVDPNPSHAGRGIELLREGGVEVVTGVLADRCTDLNLLFNHWITRGRTLLAAKMAMTLDGKFAAASGAARWITGQKARADVMRWRRYFPAVAVGAQTVLCDDPALTARLAEETWCPRRFVFDRSLGTAAQKNLPLLFRDEYKERTTVVTGPKTKADPERLSRLLDAGVKVWHLPEREGYPDWEAFRLHCAEDGLLGVYIEAGPALSTALIERRIVDYVFTYQTPKFMSDQQAAGMGSARDTCRMSEAIQLRDVRHALFGGDVLTHGWLDGAAREIRRYLIATGNPHKLEEFRGLFDGMAVEVDSAKACGGMPAVTEDGESFRENARIKARALYQQAPKDVWVLADDSGLEVDALDGAPGVWSARYAGEGASDRENVEKLLAELRSVPEDRRGARFRCVLCGIDPKGRERFYEGVCSGRIAQAARGEAGFGYDPVFVPEGFEATFAELGEAEKARRSHRARAVEALRQDSPGQQT
ncbi:MAG: bifunctional diaminohydroxyphosphoribosylaminopyrimidine deaminase/5-amino-6-(5-phosphoribosylamino)uracil reductase RibD [Opitutales bacterium]